MSSLQEKINDLIETIQAQSMKEFSFEGLSQQQGDKELSQLIEPKIKELDEETKLRIRSEFLNFGPLDNAIRDSEVTEILINSHEDIWIEKGGQLYKMDDRFYSQFTYQLFLSKILSKIEGVIDKETPILDRSLENLRICMIDECLTRKSSIICIRRHPLHQWTLEKLKQMGWCSESELELLQNIIRQRKRFLIIGPTGCGKTSAINALLSQTEPNCRSIVIEDTPEITSVNSCSLKLLTRLQSSQLKDISQSDLVKASLRLRPDRIIMGEIRGHEAKDFLMALSTGHDGSFGSLHASDPQQALIRLEMLIQMGAPHWSLESIRKLIFLSLDGILVLGKEPCGKRVFKGGYQITSLESSGFLLERWSA